jgi:ankyrin repeat protein
MKRCKICFGILVLQFCFTAQSSRVNRDLGENSEVSESEIKYSRNSSREILASTRDLKESDFASEEKNPNHDDVVSVESEKLISYIYEGSVNKIQDHFKTENRNINYQNASGQTALSIAAGLQIGKYNAFLTKESRFKIVNILLEQKADPDLDFAILKSIETCDGKIVKLLLSFGADIFRVDVKKETAMMKAHRCDIDFFNILFEQGLDINIEDEQGRTALDFVKESRNSQLVKYLESKGAK